MELVEQGTPAFVRLAAHPLRWRLMRELAASDHRVRELVDLVGQPQNLVSYHLRLLRGGGLVTSRRSSFDARDSYYHLDLERCADALTAAGAVLHPALGLAPAPPAPRIASGPRPAVLFTCTGNSARSPIAEALLERRTGGHAEVASAGSHPKARLHPGAVRVLREEHGIDVTGGGTRHLDTMTGCRFDYVVSLCDKVREVCLDLPGRPRRVHWSLPDPATSGHSAFVWTAAEIDTRIRHLLPQLVQLQQEVKP